MTGRFPNTQLIKYPRMAKMDYELWNKFIAEKGREYDSFDYDVKVGKGVKPTGDVPANLAADFESLTKKRIDAVGYQPGGVTLIEVKPRAGTSALGQLLSYSDLYKSTFPGNNIKQLALVTAFINPDEENVYDKYGIKIFVYP